MSNNYIRPIDRVLSGATTLDMSGPWSDDNEWVFRIPQSFSFTGVSPSGCLALYLGHSLGAVFVSASHQTGLDTRSMVRKDTRWGWGILPLCRDAVGVFYNPSRLWWILLSILADLNNSVAGMVLILLPQIFSPSSLFYKSLRTVPCVPATISISDILIFKRDFF